MVEAYQSFEMAVARNAFETEDYDIEWQNISRKYNIDVVILDTAGRLHVDEDMMKELQNIKKNVTVHQSILVVDAMTGQDAVTVAADFLNDYTYGFKVDGENAILNIENDPDYVNINNFNFIYISPHKIK